MKRIIFALCISFMLFSCNNDEHNHNHDETSHSDNSHSESTSTAGKTVISDTQDEISGVLELNKDSIPKMKPVELQLSLKNKAGEKLGKAEVTLDLVMPGMQMPDNKVKLKEHGDGVYTGTAMFTMKGDWRAVTLIDFQGQKMELNFDFEVK